jgi:hypothetical protein
MYAIKFTEAQLSFLFNNLEAFVESEAKRHTWYQMMDNLCWDEANQVFKPENPILLTKEQRDVFYQDMICDSEEILRQLGLDVRYHSLNDTSWGNSKWCLEMLSDIIQAIQEAEEF